MLSMPGRLSRRAFLRRSTRIGGLLAAAPRLQRRRWAALGPAAPRSIAPRSLQAPYNDCCLTPARGLNTYYGYGVDGYDEQTLLDAAQAMLDSGLHAAGYNLIVIDDGWASYERDA